MKLSTPEYFRLLPNGFFSQSTSLDPLLRSSCTGSDLAIYIHWPFCLSKCPYCDFASVPISSTESIAEFEKYILTDLEHSIEKLGKPHIKSVFFGGGTPSLTSAKSVSNILEFISKNCSTYTDMEVSLEANPGTFDRSKMLSFRSAGVNRLSLGIQSFFSENLQFLGRIYNANRAHLAAEIVANIFENFSIDLMYGYECQSLSSLEHDIKTAIDYDCKHLSCYQLTFEEKTPFYNRLMSGDIKPIGEDQEVQFYNFINDFVKSHNIFRYEVSNYARRGWESKHNLSYWKYDDYLGVGPGAHSRIIIDGRKTEIVRISDPYEWAKKMEFSSKILTPIEELQEIILVGLRMSSGIKISDILRRIPKNIFDEIITPAKATALQEFGLLSKERDVIKLTDQGFLKINSVIEFLLT